jgi:hypothetical protein
LEFFFVTSKALFCSAIYFAEACGKSVTVGTITTPMMTAAAKMATTPRNSANRCFVRTCVNHCHAAQMRLCQNSATVDQCQSRRMKCSVPGRHHLPSPPFNLSDLSTAQTASECEDCECNASTSRHWHFCHAGDYCHAPVPNSSIEAAPTFLRPITTVRRRRSSTPRHRLGPIRSRGGPIRVVGLRRRLAGALSGAVLVATVRALNPDRQP